MSGATAIHVEYVPIRLKSGKLGRRCKPVVTRVCPLDRCSRCNRLGSVTWVKRWWMRPYDPFDLRRKAQEFEPEPVLCMACMNRFRPHWMAARLVRENRLLINRIKREIKRVNAQNRG